ncbi:F-box protein SKIP28 [Tripterygium wilfordii]|uniref:F-box protein SKIP28 n=1 Tax=Tripterygium wilfordii TaxID=458696 RepID=A0A7J7DPL5_TRIWF|nr:F-box protein SKIP28 [Tripterygium wilfordii]KAF5748036.1 F-box protein SKIP28 [Tripterygium wilfordii]
MEVSDAVENQQHQSALPQRIQEAEPAGPPHEALYLVLTYLPSLFEILSMSEVCRSLRDALNTDELAWWNIIIESPLNLILSEDFLTRITSKAKGGVRTLALLNCGKITDDGLQQVLVKNSLITKLYIPWCTGLTPDGVVKAVKTLTCLKSLSINGIYNVKKEHLEMLHSCLCPNPFQQELPPILYHEFRNENLQAFSNRKIDRAIDVEVCPKCDDVRMVFDCPRETCRRTRERSVGQCRGCQICISRCEECGRCVQSDELEDAVCADVLCSDCWLQLPKCSFCNRPYCKSHTNLMRNSSSSQIICDDCDNACEIRTCYD